MTLQCTIFPRTRHWFSERLKSMCALGASHFLPLYTENQVPAVLYLEREDERSRLDLRGLPDELDPSILSRDTSISV
jgi:hypothetical protein